MSYSPEKRIRPTRLRDFSVFNVDVANLDTCNMMVVQPVSKQEALSARIELDVEDTISLPMTPIPALLWPRPVHLCNSDSDSDTAAQISSFSAASSDRRHQQLITLVRKVTKKKWISVTVRISLTVMLFA
ncbi:MAG: hypothetical protein M3Z24_00590 [Chloroflexota bacterium]|nr:hypothetical protein [Chloroflexota bacterium]